MYMEFVNFKPVKRDLASSLIRIIVFSIIIIINCKEYFKDSSSSTSMAPVVKIMGTWVQSMAAKDCFDKS